MVQVSQRGSSGDPRNHERPEWGKIVKQDREDDPGHAAGFELHLGKRFFAVIQMSLDSREEICWASVEDLRCLIKQIELLFKSSTVSSAEIDTSGVPEKPLDESRSDRAFSRMLHLWRTGRSRICEGSKSTLLNKEDHDQGIPPLSLGSKPS